MSRFGPRTPSVFSAPAPVLRNARRYCARQVVEGRLPRQELPQLLLALGLDASAQEQQPLTSNDYLMRNWNG